jgi:hypothetical protein
MSAGAMSAGSMPDLRLRFWSKIVPASDKAAVGREIAATNERARRSGLPDAFNPDLIDPAKFEALLAALRQSSGDALAPLAGRALYVEALALRIGTSSPTTVASFAHPLKLEVTDEHGDAVSVRVSVPVDCAIAKERAVEARRRTEEVDRVYKAATGDAIMAARLRRKELSRVWLDNAQANAACTPNDAAAKADLADADRMAKASVVLGGSMQ